MPLPFVPNAAKATLHGVWDGQQTINDLWFVGPDANPTVPNMISLSELLVDWWIGHIQGSVSESFTLAKVRVVDMSQANGPIVEEFTVGGAGGVSGESVPNNVDPVITFRSTVGGRSGHGRNYIPGTPNAEVTGNTLSDTFISAMVTAYQGLMPGFSNDPTPFVWSVVSYFSAGAVRPVPLSFPMASVGFTDNIVDSQRRRLPGRGR